MENGRWSLYADKIRRSLRVNHMSMDRLDLFSNESTDIFLLRTGKSRMYDILHPTFAAISSAFRFSPTTLNPRQMACGANDGAKRTICLIRLARTLSTAFSGVRRVLLLGFKD